MNSASDDELDFEGHCPVKAICIGGNRLSRGLTLEGLTVSIFVRTTGMADTLLQMARWYGFRIGYEDLIRIYTTPEIAHWFAELSLVEDDLRAEINRLRVSGLRPQDQGVRLRAHSALRLTSANKSRNAVQRRVGWSGSHPQNIVLPVNDTALMEKDYATAESFLSQIAVSRSQHGLVAYDVAVEQVVEFLRSLTDIGEARVFDFDSISSWIEQQSTEGRLCDWTVFAPSSSANGAKRVSIAGHDTTLLTRTRLRGHNSIGVLVDPKHEAIDLEGGAEAYTINGRVDTEGMRQARPQTNGLLLVYLLDPASDTNTRGRERLVSAGRAAPPAVVSVALSFPFVPDDEATTVIVGATFDNV